MATTAGLVPEFRPWADYLLAVARYYGSPGYVITSAYRTRADQQRLYDRWQAGESELPAAPPGHSAHELGKAVDIALPGLSALQDPFLRELGAAWRDAGGIWGASDPVHFEWPF